MELKDLASISGKGGLFKIIKPGRTGVLVETLDETHTRIMSGPSQRLSLLEEISIYARTKDGTVPLGDVLRTIRKKFDQNLGVDGKSTDQELRAFMKNVLPEYDEDRVYNSDIRKLVKWYGIIRQYCPEVLDDPAPAAASEGQ